eukprot:COSAG02_NODE_46215_length_350_cov_5.844622_1_plen_46_part_01
MASSSTADSAASPIKQETKKEVVDETQGADPTVVVDAEVADNDEDD